MPATGIKFMLAAGTLSLLIKKKKLLRLGTQFFA